MTPFGKFPEKGLKDLAREAVAEALADAGIEKGRIEAAYVGNAAAGVMTGQHMIRGQVVLDPLGINRIPIYNIENACASSSFAFNLACTAVAAGVHDCVLVLGFEKLYHSDKAKSFLALESGVDVVDYKNHFRRLEENLGNGEKILSEDGQKRSRLLDVYAFRTRQYMERYGLTREHFARLAVKAHRNGALNSRAQYQEEVTLDEVLASGDVVFPFTRMMCAPVSDGGAAAIVCSKSVVQRFASRPIWVSSSVVGSGQVDGGMEEPVTSRMASKLYETSGIGPNEIDVVELHDTTSSAEIMYLIELGLCSGEESGKRIETGYFNLDGGLPVNPSGGLTTKGHPVGATGLAQIYEIVHQLRGTAGGRQVKNPKVGMTHNGGGILGIDAGALALHIFKK
jgi:acetyl-CoA acetyltransferase